jgi:hypothetical protein
MITIHIRISKWIKPRYGLEASDYTVGGVIWFAGAEHRVLKTDIRENKVKIRRI